MSLLPKKISLGEKMIHETPSTRWSVELVIPVTNAESPLSLFYKYMSAELFSVIAEMRDFYTIQTQIRFSPPGKWI